MAEVFENDPFNTEGAILKKGNIPLKNTREILNNTFKPLTASPVPGPSTELLEFSSEDVKTSIENEDYKNTRRKTLSDFRKFRDFCKQKENRKSRKSKH